MGKMRAYAWSLTVMPENSLIVPTMDKPATPPHVVPQQYGSGILKIWKKPLIQESK